MSNPLKYDSYKEAFKLMKQAVENQDLAYSIAAIAITESIIADRCLSYLNYKESIYVQSRKGSHIKTFELVDKCGKHFKMLSIEVKQRNGKIHSSSDLFSEVKKWLKKRNDCLHGFAKSEPSLPTLKVSDFKQFAIETAKEGYKYATLVKSWHQKELVKSRNQSNA